MAELIITNEMASETKRSEINSSTEYSYTSAQGMLLMLLAKINGLWRTPHCSNQVASFSWLQPPNKLNFFEPLNERSTLELIEYLD